MALREQMRQRLELIQIMRHELSDTQIENKELQIALKSSHHATLNLYSRYPRWKQNQKQTKTTKTACPPDSRRHTKNNTIKDSQIFSTKQRRRFFVTFHGT